MMYLTIWKIIISVEVRKCWWLINISVLFFRQQYIKTLKTIKLGNTCYFIMEIPKCSFSFLLVHFYHNDAHFIQLGWCYFSKNQYLANNTWEKIGNAKNDLKKKIQQQILQRFLIAMTNFNILLVKILLFLVKI